MKALIFFCQFLFLPDGYLHILTYFPELIELNAEKHRTCNEQYHNKSGVRRPARLFLAAAFSSPALRNGTLLLCSFHYVRSTPLKK